MDKNKYTFLKNQFREIHDPPSPSMSVSFDLNLKYWIISQSGLNKNHILKKGDKIYKINDCTTSYFFKNEFKYQMDNYYSKKSVPIQFYVAEFPEDLYGVIHQIIIERDGRKMTIIPNSQKE
ncbi:MAG: hypothetical protein KBF93_16130 [Leptospiraceae bacterium]|nr:hypothetical protein [Leptospiraceae bacterium]